MSVTVLAAKVVHTDDSIQAPSQGVTVSLQIRQCPVNALPFI